MSNKPKIRLIAANWSLRDYPSKEKAWSDEEKVAQVKKEGFDGITVAPGAELAKIAKKAGLMIVGGCDFGSVEDCETRLKQYAADGVIHVNAQVLDHDTPTEVALPLTIKIIETGDKLGLKPAIELHRDTCTETPEKAYALADAYQKKTGKLLRMNFDYSHPAIIKHLSVKDYFTRLVERPDLLALGDLIHFRPFNGHHCQIPITDGKGNHSPEFEGWLPFCDKVIETWLAHAGPDREFVVVPEQGPRGGYGLSCFPDIWQDVIVLKNEIKKLWDKHIQNWKPQTQTKGKALAIS